MLLGQRSARLDGFLLRGMERLGARLPLVLDAPAVIVGDNVDSFSRHGLALGIGPVMTSVRGTLGSLAEGVHGLFWSRLRAKVTERGNGRSAVQVGGVETALALQFRNSVQLSRTASVSGVRGSGPKSRCRVESSRS